MDDVNQQFILSLSIIALGYVIKRLRILTENDAEVLARIILNVTMPALILTTFSRLTLEPSLLLLPVIGLFNGIFICVSSMLLFRGAERNRRGLLAMALPGANMGLFAYPLVEGIWGEAGLKYIAMYDVGTSLVIFVICYLAGCHFFV